MPAHLEDLELLKKQHAEWDRLLKKEEKCAYPNEVLIRDYKKHKLQIKQEIQEIEQSLFNNA